MSCLKVLTQHLGRSARAQPQLATSRAVASARRRKPICLAICPADAPALVPLPRYTDSCEVLVCNSMAEFDAQPDKLAEAESIMFVATGGDPTLLTPLFDKCPNIRWVHSLFAGVDALAPFISERLTARPDVPLTNGKGAFSESLAEYVLCAALHFNKRVPHLMSNRKQRRWEKFVMPVLQGQTIGFVGFGSIGQATAKLAKAFGMNVLALRRNPDKSDGLADETLAMDQKLELFSRSDVVVCVLPGTPDTLDFCGAAEFGAMKKSAIFVSCGRGTAVDEAALASALQDGKIAGAALDVFKVEPLPDTSPLWACDNALITSHNADYTDNYFDLGWSVWQSNLNALAGGSPLVTPVDVKQGY